MRTSKDNKEDIGKRKNRKLYMKSNEKTDISEILDTITKIKLPFVVAAW